MNSDANNILNETNLLDNVINKLKLSMIQNNQNLHELASSMGFSYLAVYRLFSKKHLPTINSLELIASNLNCTVSELIDNRIFLNIKCFNSINDKVKNNIPEYMIRVYINYNEFSSLIANNFFAIIGYLEKTSFLRENSIFDFKSEDYYAIFYDTDKIDIDGQFLVEYNSQKLILNILSVSSKYVIVLENDVETKIDLNLIKPIAKFFNYVEIRDPKIYEGKKI